MADSRETPLWRNIRQHQKQLLTGGKRDWITADVSEFLIE
jgi:hypothetical protein